jgi:hypothetical protein
MQLDHYDPTSRAVASYRHLTGTLSHNGDLSLTFALAGIPVFPCAASGQRCKRPLTKNGHHAATTDLTPSEGGGVVGPMRLLASRRDRGPVFGCSTSMARRARAV